ncbi:hypothetical protein HU200_016815 [Digitaria exilis]|uniref:DUF1618 domain-containing protein n=1 Tax=Digitaria exilis TaxID=1010633 RepID=A0A835F7F8_9POAL|nr:hypothetical protein HU200_016815 [Digitaria exilis]CAB3491143.1 unnamed protein product [Digitaria exilis]
MSRAISRPHGADDALVDYFVYQATTDALRRPSLLLLLPTARYDDEEERSAQGRGGRPLRQVLLSRDGTGIMSCSRRKDSESTSFVVAKLMIKSGSRPEIQVHLFRSGSESKWKVFKNLHVHGENGGRDLNWWSTDAVVPYQHRFLIWVDYYRGMIMVDMSSSESEEKDVAPPRLRYVPLPVEKVLGDPDHIEYGRGFPQGCRCVCATRDGLKFVSVDHRHTSNWGVGHREVLKWNHTFRITIWSLHEGDYTWRKDVTMYEEEFWEAVGSGEHLIPHVPPEYPVVNMDYPDIVCFRLKKISYSFEDPIWMIEVDIKKKALLAATAYSMEQAQMPRKIPSTMPEQHPR